MRLIFQRKLSPKWRIAILLLTLIVYMCVCAVIFSTLEKNNDKQQFVYYNELKLSYKRMYNLSEEQFITFAKDASVLYKRGYAKEYMDYWNFYHSFWFTTTVVTTIGFGHIVPVTFEGRLFCIFCALLGIPLNAALLKNIGERLTGSICNTVKNIEMRLFRRRDPTHVGIKATIVSFALMVTVLLVGGAAGTIFDGWSFFDGVYFNFIALSTIGFGDLFPRVETASRLDKLGLGNSGKRVFATFIMLTFMIVGLTVVSTVICSILNAMDEMSRAPATWKEESKMCEHAELVKLKSFKQNGNEKIALTEETEKTAANKIREMENRDRDIS